SLVCGLSCHPPDLELRAVPTRRPSDLGDALLTSLGDADADTARTSGAEVISRTAASSTPRASSAIRADTGREKGDPPGRPTRGRSEEHTSELQSREKLVCRLLLEKKNG